jgi:hypothetical protein
MVASSERIEKLWLKNESDNEKRGPLFDVRSELSDAFKEVSTIPSRLSEIEEHGESLISPIVEIQSKNTPYFSDQKSDYSFNVKARQSGVNDIYIALQERPKNKDQKVDDELYEYILNPDGTVVRKDELDPKITAQAISEAELILVKQAAQKVNAVLRQSVIDHQYSINKEHQERLRNRREIRQKVTRVLGGTSIALAIVSGVGIGGYFAWSGLIDGPGKEDDARRAAYDSENNVIDSEGIELDDQKLTALPEEVFDEIPSYRGGDSLESPRVVDLDSTGCAEVEIEDLAGKTLRVAVSEFNPLGALSVVAYETDGALNVCTTEDPSDTMTSSDLKIALQLADTNGQ